MGTLKIVIYILTMKKRKQFDAFSFKIQKPIVAPRIPLRDSASLALIHPNCKTTLENSSKSYLNKVSTHTATSQKGHIGQTNQPEDIANLIIALNKHKTNNGAVVKIIECQTITKITLKSINGHGIQQLSIQE